MVGGRWMPTFPNARYIMARREFEAAEAGYGNANDRTYEDNVLPNVEAGRAVLVDMDFVLDDEVWLEPAPGPQPRTCCHWTEVSKRRCGHLRRCHALAYAVHIRRLELSIRLRSYPGTTDAMGVFGGMFGQRPYRHDIAFPFAIPGNHRPAPFIILVRRLQPR